MEQSVVTGGYYAWLCNLCSLHGESVSKVCWGWLILLSTDYAHHLPAPHSVTLLQWLKLGLDGHMYPTETGSLYRWVSWLINIDQHTTGLSEGRGTEGLKFSPCPAPWCEGEQEGPTLFSLKQNCPLLTAVCHKLKEAFSANLHKGHTWASTLSWELWFPKLAHHQNDFNFFF